MLRSRKQRQQLVDTYLEVHHPELLHGGSQEGTELCKQLSKLDFWCGNNTLHLEKSDTYQDEGCCLTHTVGLPRHPATDEEMPLTPFQVDFVTKIIKATIPPTLKQFKKKFKEALNEYKRESHKFHINKGRQMGFTEIVLRLIQFFCFSRYAGRNVGIIAATNGKLAKKDLRRFARLFRNIPSTVKTWVKGTAMELVNHTIIEAFPASEEALTGDTKYACIFMDESAKWKLVDDTPVFNSVLPIVRTNGSDFFLVSTPKGPVKMFHKIHKNPEDFIKFEYFIEETIGNLYTQSQVDNMLSTSKEDPDQEYHGKFKAGRDSIFGEVTDEDRGTNWTEWDDDSIDEEDDSYVEPDDEWSEKVE